MSTTPIRRAGEPPASRRRTMSPSLRSHSVRTPALGATIACSSRLVRTVPSRVPRLTAWPSRTPFAAGEDPLRRGDDDPELGRVLALAVFGPAADHAAGGVEIGRRLDREQFDARQFALGHADQRAGRGELDRGGDAEIGHRGLAQIPAHRPGDLGDDPVDHVAPRTPPTCRRNSTAGCGPDRRPRRRRRRSARRSCAGRHVGRVERAGDRQRAQSGAGRRVGRERRESPRPSRRRRSGRRRCGWPG